MDRKKRTFLYILFQYDTFFYCFLVKNMIVPFRYYNVPKNFLECSREGYNKNVLYWSSLSLENYKYLQTFWN